MKKRNTFSPKNSNKSNLKVTDKGKHGCRTWLYFRKVGMEQYLGVERNICLLSTPFVCKVPLRPEFTSNKNITLKILNNNAQSEAS